MRNNCLNCGGSGCVPEKGARWWQFWRVILCTACGGDGYAKPPGWPDPEKMRQRPVSPPPPPPPPDTHWKGHAPPKPEPPTTYLLREDHADTPDNRRPVTTTRPAMEKGGQNPDNTSDARPAPLRCGGRLPEAADRMPWTWLLTSCGGNIRAIDPRRIVVILSDRPPKDYPRTWLVHCDDGSQWGVTEDELRRGGYGDIIDMAAKAMEGHP